MNGGHCSSGKDLHTTDSENLFVRLHNVHSVGVCLRGALEVDPANHLIFVEGAAELPPGEHMGANDCFPVGASVEQLDVSDFLNSGDGGSKPVTSIIGIRVSATLVVPVGVGLSGQGLESTADEFAPIAASILLGGDDLLLGGSGQEGLFVVNDDVGQQDKAVLHALSGRLRVLFTLVDVLDDEGSYRVTSVAEELRGGREVSLALQVHVLDLLLHVFTVERGRFDLQLTVKPEVLIGGVLIDLDEVSINGRSGASHGFAEGDHGGVHLTLVESLGLRALLGGKLDVFVADFGGVHSGDCYSENSGKSHSLGVYL